MSLATSGKQSQATIRVEKNRIDPNVSVVRCAELASPDPAGKSSVESLSDAEGSERLPSDESKPRLGLQKGNLRQRRNVSGKSSTDIKSDALKRFSDTTTTTSTNPRIRSRCVLKRAVTDAPVDVKVSCSRTNSENSMEKVRRLNKLTARVQELREEQQMHNQRAQGLEKQIKEGELACGRMIQQVLQIQQAIEIRKRHVKEDKEILSKELLSKECKMEEMDSILSRMNEIGMETNAEDSDGDR